MIWPTWQQTLDWLKRWWSWLLVGLALLWLAWSRRQQVQQVVTPELLEAARKVREEDAKAQQAVEHATAERQQAVEQAVETRQAGQQAIEQKLEKTEGLVEQPDALNSYLLGVGDKQR